MKKDQILNILFRIKNNSCSVSDLNRLANYCINISTHYLNTRHSSFFQSSGNPLNKIKDIAVDSICPLFIKSGDRNQPGIERSLIQWNRKIIDEADADFFINRLVWNRTEQTIIEQYKQNDPFFAKIYKTIATCLSENNFKKISFFGTNYIVSETVMKLSGNLISQDSFENLPDSLFFKKQSTLLNGLFDYLQLQLNLFPAIPINLLITEVTQSI